jgi:hypothetical protein
MSKQSLEPDEIEEETHIITERIIEEPSDTEQEESLFGEYIIKGAGFALGAILLLAILTGLIGLFASENLFLIVLGIVICLLILAGLAELVEE